MATAQLVIWSPALGERLSCPLDKITWLDRRLLSADRDTTLHRSPRCAGVRYVDHGWELFSHDTSYEVYVSPHAGDREPHSQQVRATASHVLPVARGGFQPHPLRLADGSWLVSVGNWVVGLQVKGTGPLGPSELAARAGIGTPTQEQRSHAGGAVHGHRARPVPDAVPSVHRYFQRKGIARLAIAYYYQEFILGAVGPQSLPITEVAVALDLTGEAAVSEYKKELQRLIWNEQGHQRELAEFLIANALLTRADVEKAAAIAVGNERSGRAKAARARLRYRPKSGHELDGGARPADR